MLETSVLEPSSSAERPRHVRPLYVPDSISKRVEVPLEVLNGVTLVFLDKELWIGTF